jgi:hypothetical protein
MPFPLSSIDRSCVINETPWRRAPFVALFRPKVEIRIGTRPATSVSGAARAGGSETSFWETGTSLTCSILIAAIARARRAVDRRSRRTTGNCLRSRPGAAESKTWSGYAFSRVSGLRTRGIARREQKAAGGFGVG